MKQQAVRAIDLKRCAVLIAEIQLQYALLEYGMEVGLSASMLENNVKTAKIAAKELTKLTNILTISEIKNAFKIVKDMKALCSIR